MKPSTCLLVSCLVALGGIAATAKAQASVEYRINLFSVTPDSPVSGSPVEVSLKWRAVVLTRLTQDIVADARIELTVGGSPVATVDVLLVLVSNSGECGDSPCDPTCGSSVIEGTSADLVCDPDTCECSTPLIETRLTTGLVLAPGTIIEVTISPNPDNESIPRVSGLLEWGSWQRRVVASRINPAPNRPDAFEIFLDWVIDFKGLSSDQGDQWLPIDLAASAHGTHLGDECPDPKNYVTCLDCCLDECVCTDPPLPIPTVSFGT